MGMGGRGSRYIGGTCLFVPSRQALGGFFFFCLVVYKDGSRLDSKLNRGYLLLGTVFLSK